MTAARSTNVDLADDLQEFIDEQIRSGRYASATEVLRDAFSALRRKQEQLDMLQSALETEVAQLDRGDYMEGTPAELAEALRTARPFDR